MNNDFPSNSILILPGTSQLCSDYHVGNVIFKSDSCGATMAALCSRPLIEC